MSRFSCTDLELNIMLLVIFVNITYLCISVYILREVCLKHGAGLCLSVIKIPYKFYNNK